MPRHRPPQAVWQSLRKQVWLRDGGQCQGPYCRAREALPLTQCHIDHIQSGKMASNSLGNLRVLCRRCHVLRLDQRHQGMIAAALRDGIIPPGWRRFAWDNDHFPSEETIIEMRRWEMTGRCAM